MIKHIFIIPYIINLFLALPKKFLIKAAVETHWRYYRGHDAKISQSPKGAEPETWITDPEAGS